MPPISPAVAAALVAVVLLALGWWLLRPRRSVGGVDPAVERRWTRHARERMQQRGISQEQVEQTLTAPDRRSHDPVERSWKFEKDYDSLTLKVWVADDPWPPTREVVIKSTAAQHCAVLRIPRGTAGRVIGRGGATIRDIRQRSGARLDIDDAGIRVTITAGERHQVDAARHLVKAALRG